MKRFVSYCLILLTIAAFFAGQPRAQSLGNNYYVDKNNIGKHNCNDSNPGTLTAPFCTITRGMNIMQPGDTLNVRGGTYSSFTVYRSGTAGKYFTIQGYANERPLVTGGQGIRILGAKYVAIKNFEVTKATGNFTGGILLVPYSGISPDYNLIQNNKVHDNTASGMCGIIVESGSFNQILNNEVYNNNFTGIRVFANATDNISGNEIAFNKSYNNTLSGGNSDGIDQDAPIATYTYIHDNEVYGNADDGIDTWNSSHNIIVRNIVHDQNGVGDGNGLKMGGSTTGGFNVVSQNLAFRNKADGFTTNGSWGNNYYNNTAYGNGGFGFNDGWRSITCTVSTCPSNFVNNIGMQNTRGNFSAYSYTASAHNNLWFTAGKGPDVYWNYNNSGTLANFYTTSGNRLDNPNAGNQSSLSVDPNFVSIAQNNFKLSPSSAAIDTGDPGNPGQVTVAGTAPDIGAFEYLPAVNYFQVWADHYGQTTTQGQSVGDYDGNGKVNSLDFGIWLHYLQ